MRIHRWLGTVSSFALAAAFAFSGGAVLAQSKIGVTSAVKNRVEGTVGGSTRPLSAGSDIFVREVVRTGEASTAQLLFLDETSLSIGPQSEVTLDRFVFDPNRKAGSVVLNANRGMFRFVSGSQQSSSYQIRTPVATIGVRGSVTDFALVGTAPNLKLLVIPVEGTTYARLASGQVVEVNIPQALILSADGTWQIITWDSTIFYVSDGGISFPFLGRGWLWQVETFDGRIDLMDQLNSRGPAPGGEDSN